MTQHAWRFIALLALASCAAPQPADQLPRVGYPYKYTGHMLTVREIQEIAAFTQRVEGIDHHVLTISVKTPTDVEVESGRGPTVSGPEYRDKSLTN
jgi:hypothetical protein